MWNTDDIKTFWEQSNLYFFLDSLFFLFFCFLSSFSFHSFNLACRNPSCTHSIPGQRPDRWFLRKKIIHLCVIALALDTNAKIIMMKTTKRARTTPLAMIASLPSNISTEDLKNISPGGPPLGPQWEKWRPKKDGMVWYFLVLSCIDTVEVILSDLRDTGAGILLN